jgi:hypothetical protein
MVEPDGAAMSNPIGLEDEETTPAPAPSERQGAVPIRASAGGDFRTYETTLCTLAFEDIYEVRLSSDAGKTARFAVDAQLAPRLAAELRRRLPGPHAHEVLRQCPSSPRREPLGEPGTHIFFTALDCPNLTVERDGDRIVLMLFDAQTSLHVSFQAGIAIDLYAFFATAQANS